jgi:hypothetical protein
MTKIKVVDLHDLYNFDVYQFFMTSIIIKFCTVLFIIYI